MIARLRRAWTAFVTDERVTEDSLPESRPDSSRRYISSIHRVASVWPVVAFVALAVPIVWLYINTGGDTNLIVAIGQHVSLYQLLDEFAPVVLVPVLAGALFGMVVGPRFGSRRWPRTVTVVLLGFFVAFLWLAGKMNGSGNLGLATFALTLAVFAGRAFFEADFENSGWDYTGLVASLILGSFGFAGLVQAPPLFPAAHIVTSETIVNGRVVDVAGGKVWALVDTDPKKGSLSINLVLLPGTVDTIEYCRQPPGAVTASFGKCFTPTDLVGPDPSP